MVGSGLFFDGRDGPGSNPSESATLAYLEVYRPTLFVINDALLIVPLM